MIADVLVMQNEVFRKVHSLEFQAAIVFVFLYGCSLKVLRNVDFCAKRAILRI